MNCPACRQPLPAGAAACPGCAAEIPRLATRRPAPVKRSFLKNPIVWALALGLLAGAAFIGDLLVKSPPLPAGRPGRRPRPAIDPKQAKIEILHVTVRCKAYEMDAVCRDPHH